MPVKTHQPTEASWKHGRPCVGPAGVPEHLPSATREASHLYPGKHWSIRRRTRDKRDRGRWAEATRPPGAWEASRQGVSESPSAASTAVPPRPRMAFDGSGPGRVAVYFHVEKTPSLKDNLYNVHLLGFCEQKERLNPQVTIFLKFY